MQTAGSVTFDLGVKLLSPLWQESADVSMASVPKVLDGQSDSSTGEKMTQPVTVEDIKQRFVIKSAQVGPTFIKLRGTVMTLNLNYNG